MFIEDYILRQIALATAVIMKVIGLSKTGQFQEAQEMIDQTIGELLGLDASIVDQMDETGLTNLLGTVYGMDSGRLFALADLFKAQGDLLAAQKRNAESQFSYQRALKIYQDFSDHYPNALESDLLHKIDELQGKLNLKG